MKNSFFRTIRWINEWKFGIFLFLNSLVFVYLFYSDINKRTGIGTREIIGDVVFKYNKIQRKFDNEVVWEDLDANSPLSNRDSVRSDKTSQATLRLKDGTEIQMDEESMVILEINEKVQKINFTKGSINVKKSEVKGGTSASILVESATGSVKVKDGDVIVAKQNPKALDVAVARGEAEVTIDGETVNLKKDQKFSSDENGYQTTNTKVKLVSAIERAKLIENKKVEKYFKVVGTTETELNSKPNIDTNTSNTQQNSQPYTSLTPNTQNSYQPSKVLPNTTTNPTTKQPEADPDTIRHKREQEAFDRFMKM